MTVYTILFGYFYVGIAMFFYDVSLDCWDDPHVQKTIDDIDQKGMRGPLWLWLACVFMSVFWFVFIFFWPFRVDKLIKHHFKVLRKEKERN